MVNQSKYSDVVIILHQNAVLSNLLLGDLASCD